MKDLALFFIYPIACNSSGGSHGVTIHRKTLYLSFLKSLQVVFIALITQRMINWISKPDLKYLLSLTAIALIGLVAFWIIGILYQRTYFIVIEKINYNIKSLASESLIFGNHQAVKADTSFFTNDLKAIEANKIEVELEIITNSIQFLTAVVSALIGSLPLTIVFMFASFLLGILQRLLVKILKKSPKIGIKAIVNIRKMSKKLKCLLVLLDYTTLKLIYGKGLKSLQIKRNPH